VELRIAKDTNCTLKNKRFAVILLNSWAVCCARAGGPTEGGKIGRIRDAVGGLRRASGQGDARSPGLPDVRILRHVAGVQQRRGGEARTKAFARKRVAGRWPSPYGKAVWAAGRARCRGAERPGGTDPAGPLG